MFFYYTVQLIYKSLKFLFKPILITLQIFITIGLFGYFIDFIEEIVIFEGLVIPETIKKSIVIRISKALIKVVYLKFSSLSSELPIMFESSSEIWEGVSLIVSNIGLIPAIAVSILYGLYAEAAVFIVVCFTSTVYHICQAGFYCVYSFKTMQTSDHFFVFGLLVWTALFFIGLRLQTRFVIFIFVQSLLLPAVMQYLESWWIGGILLAFLLLVSLSMLSYFTKLIPKLDLLDVFITIILIGGGFFFHIYAGEPGDKRYWWAHSIWHVLGMLSVYFIIEMKAGKGRLNEFLTYYRGDQLNKEKEDKKQKV